MRSPIERKNRNRTLAQGRRDGVDRVNTNSGHVMGPEVEREALETLSDQQGRRWFATLARVCDLIRVRNLSLEQASAVVAVEIERRSGSRRGRSKRLKRNAA